MPGYVRILLCGKLRDNTPLADATPVFYLCTQRQPLCGILDLQCRALLQLTSFVKTLSKSLSFMLATCG